MSERKTPFLCRAFDLHDFRGRERLIMGVAYRICERCKVMLP